LRLDIIGNVKLVEVKMTKASAEEERAPEEEEDEAEMASAVDQEGVPEADISPEEAPQEVQGAERTPGDQDVAQEILKAPETVEPAHSISIQQPTVELETFVSVHKLFYVQFFLLFARLRQGKLTIIPFFKTGFLAP